MILIPECNPASIDLRQFIRPGDQVVIGHGAAEPLSLVKALARQVVDLPRFGVFVGHTLSGLFDAEFARNTTLTSTMGIGGLGKLARDGLLNLVPAHYADLPRLMRDGPYSPSVVMVQVSPADSSGYHSFGVSVDHAAEAVRYARVVIAEVNDQMPRTAGSAHLHSSQITAAVRISRPLIQVSTPEPSPTERAIGRHVAGLVSDASTIQLGIGAVPSVVGMELGGKRNLRVHSGLVGDWLLELSEAGSLVSSAQSEIVSTLSLLGSRKLYDFVAKSPWVAFKRIDDLNSFDVIARIPRFVAINSALQIDLSGQVNAEVVHNRYIGAIGGQQDFSRAAQLSVDGRSIVALPSTSSDGSRSRIVAQLDLGCVTTPRANVDYVVTEHGVAYLKGRGFRERFEALTGIAAPQFRADLALEFDRQWGRAL